MKGTIVARSGSYGAKLTIDGSQLWVGTFAEREHARLALERTTRSPYPTMTIGDLVERWTSRPAVSEETHRNNEYNTRSFVAKFGSRPAASLLRIEAVHWTEQNFGGAKFAKALLGFGVSIGVLEDNPFAGLTVTKKARPKITPTPDDVARAASTALRLYEGRRGLLLHDLVLVAAHTGLRLHELAGLRSERVEVTASGLIRLHIVGKGQKYRVVPVPGPVEHIILRRMCTPLMFGDAGKVLTRQRIHDLMKPVREATGLDDMNWHLLRHHFATQMADRGVLDRDAALVMFGHSNPRLLHDVYAHPDRGKAVDRVARQLA